MWLYYRLWRSYLYSMLDLWTNIVSFSILMPTIGDARWRLCQAKKKPCLFLVLFFSIQKKIPSPNYVRLIEIKLEINICKLTLIIGRKHEGNFAKEIIVLG
mmetsp:Transcript_48328/g.55757  ORF Transcript_48328/g.55757 Transcript_48328/m.55757 type:complete len:101 (+) Transcript_48328:275-577(+)